MMIRNRITGRAAAKQAAAFLTAFALFAIFLLILGKSPLRVYKDLFYGAFGSGFSLRNTFTQTAPLMLAALCTIIPAQLGLVIIGNEGALLFGGLTAAVVGSSLTGVPPVIAVPVMFLAAALVGAVWIGQAGALKQFRGVDPTISSLLLFYVALALFLYLVEGPLRDPLTLNKPSTASIPDAFKTGMIPGLGVHYGFLVGIILCVLAYFVIRFTPWGFSMKIVGSNPRVAAQLGLPVNKLVIAACCIGGACAGLAGAFEVAAIHYNANASLRAGIGFSGILVAFAARQNALAAIPVALLLGGLKAAGGLLQRRHHLSDATIDVFEGILFLTILASEIYRYIKFRNGRVR